MQPGELSEGDFPLGGVSQTSRLLFLVASLLVTTRYLVYIEARYMYLVHL